MHKVVLVALAAMLLVAAPAQGADVRLKDLRVERKVAPVGIDVEKPRFSWVIESSMRDLEQKAYRVQVFDGAREVWHSGTVRSRESTDVEYAGPKLAPAKEYTWYADVQTKRGWVSERSAFRTGLYSDADWAGSKWIGNARPGTPPSFDGSSWIWTPEATQPNAPAEPRAFRKTFGGGVSAEIAITADDLYTLWVNGKQLGATTGAENEWQQARRFFTALDPSRNVIAVRTNNGAGSPAGLLVTVRVTKADGTTETFRSDTSWKAAKTFPEDFARPDLDDAGWGTAVVQAAYGSGPWGRNVRTPRDAARPAPLVKRAFDVDGRVKNATLFYAAGGYADFTINGARASKDVLTPGFTDYDDTVQYTTADLTDALKSGVNTLGAELGRGFYGMTGGNVWRWEAPPWHDEPVVRARLRIEYADGRVQDVVTDSSWQIADGPTVFDDLYAGETYDARVTPGPWVAASEVAGPKGVLVNQRQQPIRVTESLPATEITQPAAGVYVVKFPRVLAGWVEYAVAGPAGTTIRAQAGEKLLANGRVNFNNNGGFQAGFQTDRFILAGTGKVEKWAPRFSYKGFQYIEVTGWPGDAPPPLSAFTAKAVHTDVAETGTFESSSEIMNKTHRAVVDTLRNNLHGIPTDTPMFEKNGWTGDAAVGAEMFMLNLDTHELFAKWMRDLHETREANGRPMVIAPSSGNWGVWGIAPPWHSAYVMIPRWLLQYGNDKRPLAELYDGMKQYVDLEYDTSTGGIVNNARLGDWVSPEASPDGGNAPEDLRVSATAYLYAMLESMEGSARILGREADVAWFAARAQTVRDAFNARFLVNGYYQGSGDRGYRQTHNVLAVAFGLVPDAAKQGVVDTIAADVRAKGDTLNTGVLGTKYLLPVLTENGYADLAYTLATQTKYPSWGYMIENGATSMWEHWALAARSRGHYFLGTVDDWFYKYVGGIRASETEGYRELTIAPAVTGSMTFARTTTRTPYGTVVSDWRTRGRALELRVEVPVGSRASVLVPADNVHAVTEGGAAVDGEDVGDAVRVEVGSGSYVFVSDERAALVGRVIEQLDGAMGAVQPGEVKMVVTARDQAQKALKKLRAGDVTEAATALAKAARALSDVASRPDLINRINDTLGTAVSDLLDVKVTAAVSPGEARPGDPLTATVTVTNGARATLEDTVALLAGFDGWDVGDAEPSGGVLLRPRATQAWRIPLTVPAGADPGTVTGGARVSYTFERADVTLSVPVKVSVVSALSVASMTVAPSVVRPGGTATVTTTLRNAGRAAASGAFRVQVPSGWAAPAAQDVTVPAEGELVVTTSVAVPRDAPQAARDVPLTGSFRSVTGSATVRVELDALPAGADRIDLGASASEQAHGLTAAPSSGTSSEAGLTRRYAGHLTPFSWFEFGMAVKPGSAFVVRAIETYDRAQTKRYKVYVDGVQVHLRQFSKGGAGTETYEFLVPASLATDDRVRIRFENQDDPSFYDPSIADVWTYPLQ